MEIKLFGKSLFKFRSGKTEMLWGEASTGVRKSKYLPDFYEGMNDYHGPSIMQLVKEEPVSSPKKKKAVKGKKKIEKKKITPKGVYDLKLLDDNSFKLNTNAKYIDNQILDFKDKLNLISAEEYDMQNGVREISSVVIRLENRRKYAKNRKLFEEFPYTTTTRVNKLIKDHDHLQIGKIAQFIADMPKEATEIMKEYNKSCKELCDKQAVYYIVADKKDFKKSEGRRDPILLVQSPFGHFWQILGAWDKEMLLLEEL